MNSETKSKGFAYRRERNTRPQRSNLVRIGMVDKFGKLFVLENVNSCFWFLAILAAREQNRSKQKTARRQQGHFEMDTEKCAARFLAC